MAYERQPHPRRAEITYGGNGPQTTLTYTYVYEDVATRASSAKIAIDASDGTALVASTAMTATASPSAQFTYVIDASDTDDYPLGEGYKVTIVVTYDSKTYTDTLWMDVVRRPMVPTLVDAGLQELEQETAHYKDDGETDWSKKIFAAWSMLMGRIRQKCTQDGYARPALIIGYDQLYETHRLWTLELLFFDRTNEGEGNAYKYEQYKEMRQQELDSALGTLSYSGSDAEDPGVPEPENFTGITLTR